MIQLRQGSLLIIALLLLTGGYHFVPKGLGAANNCYPESFVGTWRRVTKPIDQQMTFWPSGDYDNILYSPGVNASTGFLSTCGTRSWTLVVGYTVDAQFGMLRHPQLSADGKMLTLFRDRVVHENFGKILTLSAADTAITYRRITELPKIDWDARARDGGYTWDFPHACPARSDPAYHALIPQLIENTLFWESDGDLPIPYIRFEEDRDGTLRWQFGKSDRVRVRRFCRPDRNTLIVEQPGPRGVSLPHRYDVFARGGLSYFNGLQVSYKERTSETAPP